MTSQRRSHQEMVAVYEDLADQGKEHEPYVLAYNNSDQNLIFFGSMHSNNLQDRQWAVFDLAWESFINQPNNDKLLIHENYIETIETAARRDSISKYGEIGLAMWSAKQADIPMISGEPNREQELKHLKEQFSEPEIITYYLARQMHQWLRQDREQTPDWRNYINHLIEGTNSVAGWKNPVTPETAIGWYQQITGKEFDPENMQAFYSLSDPSQNPVSSASGSYRDQYLEEVITANWQAGKSLFVIYGSGHAITLEPVLMHITGGASSGQR